MVQFIPLVGWLYHCILVPTECNSLLMTAENKHTQTSTQPKYVAMYSYISQVCYHKLEHL